MNKVYDATKAEYGIKWDIYYCNLSILVFDGNKKIAKIILYISEILQNINFLIKEYGIIYDAIYEGNEDKYKAVFKLYSCREDVVSKLNIPVIEVKEKNKKDTSEFKDIINAVIPGKNITEIHKKKFEFLKKKFLKLNLPGEIYIEEGFNIHQRAFACAAVEKEIKIKFTFRAGKIIKNLEFPGPILCDEYNSELKFFENVAKNKRPIINKKCIIVAPTYNDVEKVSEWIESCIEYFDINIDNCGISIHPSYRHQISQLNEALKMKIDNNKNNYVNKYEYAIGCYSTMLNEWSKKGKKVLAYTLKKNKNIDEIYMRTYNSDVSVYIGGLND